MKLLVTRRMTDAAEQALKARFDTTILDRETGFTPDEAAQALAEYDAILPTLGDRFSAEAFAAAPRCRLLANFGAGYNHIDTAAAAAVGVAVTNTPHAVTEATADIALTLILMTARRAGEGERLLRRGGWTGWQPTQLLGRHVSGKTVGIVGMGRIGKAIARRCHFGFGMEVVFHNRSTVSALDFPARQVSGLDEMLALSDFAVVAVPGGAGLDVYEFEPQVAPALCAMENVTLLPHLGTAAEEVRTAMAMQAMSNLLAFDQGRALPDRVN